jgi:hypothetical protein
VEEPLEDEEVRDGWRVEDVTRRDRRTKMGGLLE